MQNLNCQLIEERKGLNEQNAQDSLMIKDLLDRIKQKDEEINNLQDQVNKNNESSRNFQNDIVKVENFEIIRNVIKVQDVGTNCNLKNCGNKSAEGFDMCFLM